MDGLVFIEEVNKANVQFMSITESIDTKTSSGKVLLTILLAFAQNEREQISERTKMGLYGSAMKGNYPKPSPPYGYKIVDKKLVIVEEKAFFVRKVFDLYVSGKMSKLKIANFLNEVSDVRKWRFDTIDKIINNKIYIGTYESKDCTIENHSPAIISEDVFIAASVIQEQYKLFLSNDYLFQNILVNHELKPLHCTTTVKPNGKKYVYYREPKNKTYINESTFLKNKILPLLVSKIIEKENDQSTSKVAEINSKIRNLQGKISYINQLLISKDMLPVEANTEKQIVYNEILELEKELKLYSNISSNDSINWYIMSLARKELIKLISDTLEIISINATSGKILSVKYK